MIKIIKIKQFQSITGPVLRGSVQYLQHHRPIIAYLGVMREHYLLHFGCNSNVIEPGYDGRSR